MSEGMNRGLDDGPAMKREYHRKQDRLVEVASRNGSCKHENGSGYCHEPDVKKDVRRCKHAMRVNVQRHGLPAVACEREL